MRFQRLTRLRRGCGAVWLVIGLALADPRVASAATTASGSLDLTSFSLTPSSGSLQFQSPWSLSAVATVLNSDGAFNQGLDFSEPASASASASGPYATANTFANYPAAGGSFGHADGNITIPSGVVESAAVSGGFGNFSALDVFFAITGASDPSVSVSISAALVSQLVSMADASGEVLHNDAIFNLDVDGSPVLSFSDSAAVGANGLVSRSQTPSLTDSLDLSTGASHELYIELDFESQVATVPESGGTWMLFLIGLGSLGAGRIRLMQRSQGTRFNRYGANSTASANRGIRARIEKTNPFQEAKDIMARPYHRPVAGLILTLAVLSPAAFANYIGGEAPFCKECAAARNYAHGLGGVGLAEGNLRETMPITTLQSASGPTLDLNLAYDSYDADGSKAELDTVAGYGWTHPYNQYLFGQVGSLFRMDGDGRTEKFRAGPGGTYTADTGYFETLLKNPDGSYTLSNKLGSVCLFATVPGTPYAIGGPVYRLQSMVDRNGNLTTLAYAGGNLTRVTDTYGRSILLSYTSLKQLAQITDPLGRSTKFAYDASGRRLASITDPNGKTTTYTYNNLNQIISKVDRDGRAFTYQYQGNLPVGAKDNTGANLYDLSNPSHWGTSFSALAALQERVYVPSTTQETDGRGNVWAYQYDSNAYLTARSAPDGATTTYTYDPATLRLASMTDANGRTTHYQYDTRGNLLQMTDPLGDLTTCTYEPVFNQMTSITDPKGRVTVYEYDSRGNRTNEIDDLGQTRSWTYDPHGNVLSATDKNGHTTTCVYDAFGDRIQETDPLGNVTSWTYDAVGNMLSRTDANGHTTSWQYDGLNRMTVEVDAVGNETLTFYDGEGDRVRVIDRNGHVTTNQFDQRQRLVQITDALGHVSTSTYDGNNNRTTDVDRDGRVTSYNYDAQGRRTQTTNALGGVATTVYDGVGNTLSQTDPNLHTTSWTYDALNRKVTMTDALGNETAYAYDMGGLGGCSSCGSTPGSSLLTTVIDADGKVTYYKYDGLDRLIDVIRKVGPTNDTITASDAVLSTTYDPVGNQLTIIEPNGNIIHYGYDADNRRIAETNASGDITLRSHDGVGNVITTTEPNGNVTTNHYDALYRVIQVADGGGIVTSSGYDPVGNRTSQADGDGDTSMYAYDAINRLVSVTDPLGHSSATAYDPVGNVLQTTDRNGNSTLYIYDVLNRRISMTDALGDTTQYQYDAVENLLRVIDANGHATDYGYDADNRLSAETYANGGARAYTYDGMGKILTRTDQLGRTTTYSYDDLYYLTERSYPSSLLKKGVF